MGERDRKLFKVIIAIIVIIPIGLMVVEAKLTLIDIRLLNGRKRSKVVHNYYSNWMDGCRSEINFDPIT